MRASRVACLALAVAGIILAPTLAHGQTAPAAPPTKTIGKPSSAGSDIVPSLIVMNSRSATLQGDTLTLFGVPSNSILFADRPVRAAGHGVTTKLLEEWNGNGTFAKDPPNATVSAFSKDGSTVKNAVVVLKTPNIDGDKLTFTVQVLEGDLAGADGAASIFIDIFGVWRRAAYRGVFYAGAAAATGAAAYGAAVYGAPSYYPHAPPACGYYPYPPCY